jgi:hypothetical protein
VFSITSKSSQQMKRQMTETNNPVKRRRVDSINSINFKRLVDEAAHEDEPTTTASTKSLAISSESDT